MASAHQQRRTSLSVDIADTRLLVDLVYMKALLHACFQGLADGLGQCGLRSLRRLVLRRTFPDGYYVNHDAQSCRAQKRDVADALRRTNPAKATDVLVECDRCDKK